jgi:hypothetical protein
LSYLTTSVDRPPDGRLDRSEYLLDLSGVSTGSYSPDSAFVFLFRSYIAPTPTTEPIRPGQRGHLPHRPRPRPVQAGNKYSSPSVPALASGFACFARPWRRRSRRRLVLTSGLPLRHRASSQPPGARPG